MVQQPAEARSLNGVEAPQLSRDAVHEPFMFVLKTKILQDFDRRCLKCRVGYAINFPFLKSAVPCCGRAVRRQDFLRDGLFGVCGDAVMEFRQD